MPTCFAWAEFPGGRNIHSQRRRRLLAINRGARRALARWAGGGDVHGIRSSRFPTAACPGARAPTPMERCRVAWPRALSPFSRLVPWRLFVQDCGGLDVLPSPEGDWSSAKDLVHSSAGAAARCSSPRTSATRRILWCTAPATSRPRADGGGFRAARGPRSSSTARYGRAKAVRRSSYTRRPRPYDLPSNTLGAKPRRRSVRRVARPPSTRRGKERKAGDSHRETRFHSLAASASSLYPSLGVSRRWRLPPPLPTRPPFRFGPHGRRDAVIPSPSA